MVKEDYAKTLSLMDWLTILGIVFASGIGGAVFIFSNFLTKGEGELIQRQLDRIEAKIDRVISSK